MKNWKKLFDRNINRAEYHSQFNIYPVYLAKYNYERNLE